jgi:hypothetical protein
MLVVVRGASALTSLTKYVARALSSEPSKVQADQEARDRDAQDYER